MMEFKQECKYFISDRPCKFHKIDNRIVCVNCKHYIEKTQKYEPQVNTDFFNRLKTGCGLGKNKKIVIIKLAALGDVVRTTSILKPLFKKYKNPQIYWVTHKEAFPVLDNNPYIKEKIAYETAWQLISEKFDVLINLDLDKEALRLTKLISAAKKIGFYLDENDKILCSNIWAERWFALSHSDILKKRNKKTYQEYMLKVIGIESYRNNECPIIINLTAEEKKFAEKFAKQNNITKKDFVIGINTGGGDKWPKKEWPVENTVELIKKIVKSEKLKVKSKFKILIFGGEKEKERNKKIVKSLMFNVQGSKINKEEIKGLTMNSKLLTNVIDTGTNNSLRQFFALLNLCNLMVVTDSLALHVFLGLGKSAKGRYTSGGRVIALFGPTSSKEIELYGLGKKIVSKKDCINCYNKNCKKTPDCMQLIKAETVFNSVKSLV